MFKFKKKENSKQFRLFRKGKYIYTNDETYLSDMVDNTEQNEVNNLSTEKKISDFIIDTKKDLQSSDDVSSKISVIVQNLKSTNILVYILILSLIIGTLYVCNDIYNNFKNPDSTSSQVLTPNNIDSELQTLEESNKPSNISPQLPSENDKPSTNSNEPLSTRDNLTYLISCDTSLIEDITNEKNLVESYYNNTTNYAAFLSKEKNFLSIKEDLLKKLINNEELYKQQGLEDFYNCLKERLENSCTLTTNIISDLTSKTSNKTTLKNNLNNSIDTEILLKEQQNKILITTLTALNIEFISDKENNKIYLK